MKNKFIVIALLLVVAIAIPISSLPLMNAQLTKNTYPYLGAMPNPVGVGQEVLLHIGITDMLQHVDLGWEGLTVSVTRPDGTTETLGPFRTDSTGGTGSVYVPTMLGTYQMQTHFPEQEMPIGIFGYPAGTIMKASTSQVLELVVQENPVEYYPSIPLPTEYWTRPIDSQMREWASISGSWLEAKGVMEWHTHTKFVPYNQGPESAHILWTTPLVPGGIIGGEFEGLTYETGDAYEGKFQGSVIINGKLYFNRYSAQAMVSALGSTKIEEEVVAINLHTGEELWTRTLGNNETLAFGQIMYWDTMNMHGAFSYLWTTVGSRWNAYDPLTGRWVYSITGVPSGTRMRGSNGEILIYTVNAAQGWMRIWNSTRAVHQTYVDLYLPSDQAYYNAGRWRPQGITFNASKGIQLEASLPAGISGSAYAILDDRIVGAFIPNYYGPSRAGLVTETNREIGLWSVSLEPGREGQLLFNRNWTAPAVDVEYGWILASQEDEVFILYGKATRTYHGFNLNNGQPIWQTEPQNYVDMYADVRSGAVAYGKFFSVDTAGIVYSYDIKTGALLWTYEVDDRYSEILWANNWWSRIQFITDGKIYMGHTEHSPIDPRPRGAPFLCLDVETGEVVWRADGLFRQTRWGGFAIIGDSIIASLDTYDMRIYAIGKGPSAITVSAPDVSVDLGKSVVIKGTVTDISPGTQDYALKARFPNGVPAIDDEFMSEYMLYVYKQFPKPAQIRGVPVNIDVIDANGNHRNIGSTTSDATGFFSFEWQPDIEGKYTVVASFAGSKSYYPSNSHSAFTVGETTSQTPEQPQLTLPPMEMYLAAATAAIIVAIAIVGLLILRKRP